MAGYYIQYNNQAEQGSAANDLFQIVPTTARLTGVIINAMGGTDTIQVNDSNGYGFQATVLNLDPSSTISLGKSGYYVQQADGVQIVDGSGKVDLKLVGSDTSIFNNNTGFTSLNRTSSIEGQTIYGTDLSDYIVINHQKCSTGGRYGDDTIIAYTDGNSLAGNRGNDLIIAYGNNNELGSVYPGYTYVEYGDDTLVSDGANNILYDISGNNMFIVGGNNNTAVGSANVDTFEVYSYSGGATNVTLTGGGNNDAYIFSTGLPSVAGTAVGATAYNPYSADTVNVAITDFDSLDTIYLRSYALTAINHAVGTDGIVIADDTGRVNIKLSGQLNWDAVKYARITYDDAQGNVGTVTLEQAVALPIWRVPAGVYISGDYMNISSAFVGNMLMSGSANYVNGNIVTIDATSNPQAGMLIAGNENTNAIYAGYGGNVLWGGSGFFTNDYLVGGAGADIFMAGRSDGNDVIMNTDVNDTVNLYDANLSDIVSFYGDANSLVLGFNTGNAVAVASSEVFSPKFQLANGESYRYNRATAAWQQA